MVEERRRTTRARVYLPARLQQVSPSRALETLTKDLSDEGVRCLSPVSFPVATELSVELGLTRGSEPVTIKGRLAWFRSLPYSEQFDLGIVFTEVSPQTKRRLSTYLERLSK